MDEKIMSGSAALERMRNLKLVPGATFGIKFITCDLTKNDCGQIRIYDCCRLRPARRNEGLNVDPMHYIFFSDENTGNPRQCFKWLVRAVCFPPNNIWYKINWFE